MHIVADENIPLVKEYFGQYGEINLLPGRKIQRSDLMSAELLLVRSVTSVGESLLQGSAVKFVGSATIGEDHISKQYLQSSSIGYSNAPGANANSVVEYVFAAIIDWCNRRGRELATLSLGIIGVGAIGSALRAVAEELGLEVNCYDPPKGLGSAGQVPLQIIRSDVISIHTPLTNHGLCATHHLIDGEFLASLPGGQLLINSSRGAVVDNCQLHQFLKQNPQRLDVALDVWEGEPSVNLGLLEEVLIATPHIAGYSYDGKVLATRMLHQAWRSFIGLREALSLTDVPQLNVGETVCRTIFEIPVGVSLVQGLQVAVNVAFDIRVDDQKMRDLKNQACDKAAFDDYRKNYPKRREFNCFQFNFKSGQEDLARHLGVLGFHTVKVSGVH